MWGAAPLDVLPLWAMFAATLVGILLAGEVGHRLGRLRLRRSEHEQEPPVGGMVAAELGLLAFLLAFTFSLGASRFEARRQVLLDETNAIGTAYLRAGLLPESHRDDVRRLLREYVDVRLAAAQDGSAEAAVGRSNELHDRLWSEAVAAMEKDPRSVATGLFVQSLNDVIDRHAERVMLALRSRIPWIVWGVLFAVTVLSFGTMGYQSGLTGKSRSPAVLAIALTFATVLWLVVDLDRPRQGLLRVSQQPMIDLRNTMAGGSD